MGFLEGVSPWWWVALAILLATVELLTASTVTIWSAGAAMIVAAALWVRPDLAWPLQVGAFAILSIAFTFAGRAAVARWGDGSREAGNLNRRAAQIIGREAVVESFANGEGRITIDGVPWPARLEPGSPTPAPGDRVEVVDADGIVARIRFVKKEI